MRFSSPGAAKRARVGLAALSLTLAALAPAHAAAPATPALAQEIDRLLTAAYPAGEPGAAALVVRGGEVVLRKGYGMANLELAVPIAPETVFEIGSITKQFTAAAVLLLAERGKLRLTDDVTKVLPDYPTHGQTITIENLLTHTSGIPSYTGMPEWAARMKEDVPLAELIAFFKDKPLEFVPGTRWSYSNSGYVVLGAVIEKASGESYAKFVEEEVMKPCGMKSSRYGSFEELVSHRAQGYDGAAPEYRNTSYISMTQPFAAGALLSTVDDLAAWDRALAGETLLHKASLDRMTTPFKLRDGSSARYGYGLGISELGGRKLIEHGGAINGFSADLLRVPEERLAVVILSNNPGHDPRPEGLAHQIARLALGLPLGPTPVAIDRKGLDDYVGVYRDADKTVRSVTQQDGHLYAARETNPKIELLPIGPDRFVYAKSETTLRFVRDGRRQVTGAVFDAGFGPETALERSTEPVPEAPREVKVDPALFDSYVGTYELMPGFDLTVTREADHLFTQATGQERFEIFPRSETRFFLKVVAAEIEFVRGADGKVEQIVLHQGGRDLPGKRIS